ncbi:MAG: M48 family metalloprotease [Synergistaceae bacterium]|jgi:putative metalloprotease|nr:M48 family metalloprotease [Synergistaceae bacterium]
MNAFIDKAGPGLRGVFTASFLAAALVLSPQTAAWAAISEKDVRQAWLDVSKVAEMEPLPLSIEKNESPNAWVTSGKSVTVTTGLMDLLESGEEIFGVLAHEEGHAKLRHYESRAGNAAGVGLAAVLLGRALGGKTLGNAAVELGANLATAGYSREQEVAADDFATDLAFKGGHDPTGLYTALQRISLFGGKTEPSGFNSHPPDDRRLKRIHDRIVEKKPDAVFPTVEKLK